MYIVKILKIFFSYYFLNIFISLNQKDLMQEVIVLVQSVTLLILLVAVKLFQDMNHGSSF